MTTIHQGNFTDYLSLYQTLKPVYAYYTLLNRRVEKCDNHTFLLGKREMNALLILAQEVIKLTPQIHSLSENFRRIGFFEQRKCFLMTLVQESAKKRVFSMLGLKTADQSARFLSGRLKDRLKIIEDLAQPNFALTISKACVKIAYALLFERSPVILKKKLGFGSYGTIEKVELMGQVCAKKTFIELRSETLREINKSVLFIIQMANPQICDVYLTENSGKQIYFEAGFGDFHHIFRTNWERGIRAYLPTYIEDLLIGFSNMHFGLSRMDMITLENREIKDRIKLFNGTPPLVHGDIKPANTLLAQNSAGELTAKIIDLDTAAYQSKKISHPTCTYEFTSPDAAAEYKNPLGFNRQISIYDDSWSLGCTLYHMLFSDYIYLNRLLTDRVEKMTEIAAITQEMIDEKLNKPLDPQRIFLLGAEEFEQCLTYLEGKDPASSLRRKDRRELQRKLGERESKRLIGVMRGLLTVDVKQRLTADQARNIYYLAETKLRSKQEEDFDHTIPDMEFELQLHHSKSPTFPLKIESTVCAIQRTYRKYLTHSRPRP